MVLGVMYRFQADLDRLYETNPEFAEKKVSQ